MVKDTEKHCITINCSLKLIQIAVDEGWIKHLAFWHLERSNYGNLAIYNYKSRMAEIANRHSISVKTLYNYFKILREQELIFDFKNNLSFLSIKHVKRNLSDKRKTQITISKNETVWSVQCRLYAKLIEHHFKKIAFKEAFRRFGSHVRHDTESGVGGFQPSFSIRNVSKLLNIQTDKAIKVIKNLETLNIIRVHPSKSKIIAKNATVDPDHVSDLPGRYYSINGNLYIRYGSKIELVEYPAVLPKITLKIYVKHYKSINQ